MRREILVGFSLEMSVLSLSAGWAFSFELEVVVLVWRRAVLVDQRASLGFFALPARGAALLMGALRFVLELGSKGLVVVAVAPVELVVRIKLIWAIAEPLLSYLAWAMRGSSWLSASQQNSHAWTSRERPRVSLGGSGPALEFSRDPVRVEMGGNVTEAWALWLRCRFGRDTGGRAARASADGRGGGRWGGVVDSITWALPSRESERRNCDDWELGAGRTSPWDMEKGSSLRRVS